MAGWILLYIKRARGGMTGAGGGIDLGKQMGFVSNCFRIVFGGLCLRGELFFETSRLFFAGFVPEKGGNGV